MSEVYISVDVESSGPIPGDYSLLSIGACTLDDPPATFYIELQPINDNFTEEACAVHQLSLEQLRRTGISPKDAMQRFAVWLEEQTQGDQTPLCVAFNAAFDWMFINYYFIHYLGHNPFGHTAIDIKAFYMGMRGVPWSGTSWRSIDAKYKAQHKLAHHALQDALDQAEMFKLMLKDVRIT